LPFSWPSSGCRDSRCSGAGSRKPWGGALLIPYVIYGAGTGSWRILPALGLCGFVVIVLGIYALFPPGSAALSWQDIGVLLLVALPVYAGWFRDVWPFPVYLDFMARLFAVALIAFAVLSVRRLDGVGFEWRLVPADWLEGLKQLGFFTVIGIPLGFAMQFITWNPRQVGWSVLVSFIGIFVFIAIQEELFFRGTLQNLLEMSTSNRYAARAIASAIFGLSHIHHGFPNWRYVILAAVAGWFYGSAWHNRRSLMAAGITHAAVDTLWRHFLTL
jgi:membrane protease YdiL (CAAX protease family)